MNRRRFPILVQAPKSNATAFAILAEGAFAMLRPELDKLPGAPRTAAEFVGRLVSAEEANDFVSPAEVGRIMGVTRQTVVNWSRDGRIRSVRVGHLIKIPAAELKRLQMEGVCHE